MTTTLSFSTFPTLRIGEMRFFEFINGFVAEEANGGNPSRGCGR
jgi:hypothetical protein